MPTYDYRCDRCERTFEVRQRISDEPLTTCDRCGGPIRRLLSAAPFILKGGGWYVTDYPSAGRKKGMEAEKKSSGDPASERGPVDDRDGRRASTGTSSKSERRATGLGRRGGGEAEANSDVLQLTAGARPDPEPSARAPLPHEHLDPARAVDQRPERPRGRSA